MLEAESNCDIFHGVYEYLFTLYLMTTTPNILCMYFLLKFYIQLPYIIYFFKIDTLFEKKRK